VDLLAAVLLGVVQGLTEFLPVSSSGHLILAREFFGWDGGRFGLAFDVACHVGTLAAVVAYFRADVAGLVAAIPGALAGRPGEYERLGRLILVGTIPVVIVGLLFSDLIEGAVRTPGVVAVALAAGGLGLLLAERVGRQQRDHHSVSLWEALLVGAAQAVALVPGVSRSGVTITAAMLLGLRRGPAARFVFLLSLPAVMAAAAKEGLALAGEGTADLPFALFAVGMVVSGLVGYWAIAFFVRWLERGSLAPFAVYRLAVAAGTAVWMVTR
jgi:undecaprenyl-diphosphatase